MTSDSDETPTRVSQVQGTLPDIPGIQVVRELGRGGMAVVFEGLDLNFNPPRRIAVKVMSQEISSDQEFRKRFEREAALVATFRHDGIIHVYACGEAKGAKYIVMEFLPGGTLADRLADGALPYVQAIGIAAQLAAALSYAHQRDVIHRDIKPANLLFTNDGKAVLSDFGVAKVVTLSASNLTRHAMVIGSTRYMSPEQERAEEVTDRADVYALGLVLFEMLTGKPPPAVERVLRRVEDGRQVAASLSPFSGDLSQLVCRCLLIAPEQRPSAQEVSDRLATQLAPTRTGAAKRVRRPWRPVALAAGVAGAAIVAFIGWRSLQGTSSPVSQGHPSADSTTQISPAFAALVSTLDIVTPHDWLPRNPAILTDAVRTFPRHAHPGTTAAERAAAVDLCNHPLHPSPLDLGSKNKCTDETFSNEPVRDVVLKPFEMDTDPVTVAQFREFVDATGYRTDAERKGVAYAFAKTVPGGSWREDLDGDRQLSDWPVVSVSYNDAVAYCRWRHKRLPTADEWEYAARGPTNEVFPWGNDPAGGPKAESRQPVGSLSAQGDGMLYRGLAGAVWQWTQSPGSKPGESPETRILKGAPFEYTEIEMGMRSAYHALGEVDAGSWDVGIRCASDATVWPDADYWLASALHPFGSS